MLRCVYKSKSGNYSVKTIVSAPYVFQISQRFAQIMPAQVLSD